MCNLSNSIFIDKICYFIKFLFKVFDNYAVTVMIGGEPYTLGLFDTAGKIIFKHLNRHF